ncbi:MAG TPA: nuclear transport factor 2 family protein [Candidatus Binatia bacterium]|nr:nuclear transport factor 2 family protein [Candidatus Binatia bacterium]
MDNAELAKQLTVLQDVEAIKQLKAEYCDICDDEHNQERIVTIFAADGIWEGKGIGRAQGHAEIRNLFKSFAERISFSQHNVFNPRITVNGAEAHGSWNFLGPFTFRKGSRQLWLAARYEDDYVKINGQWKFKHLRAFGRMAAPYEKGWASGVAGDVFANER